SASLVICTSNDYAWPVGIYHRKPVGTYHRKTESDARERPRYSTVDEDLYEIATVLDQWYEPSATYFKVQSTEGKTYLLRYDEDRMKAGLLALVEEHWS